MQKYIPADCTDFRRHYFLSAQICDIHGQKEDKHILESELIKIKQVYLKS